MEVKDRQCLLMFLKRRNGSSYYSGAIDGICGSLTRAAIRDFQEDTGLMPTGTGDAETDQALRQAVAYGISEKNTGADFWEGIRYFTREEFRCKCGGKYCGGYPAEPRELLAVLADRARAHFGKPGYVVSGLRCREWNRLQGGVADSQHMYGEAVDLYVEDVAGEQLLAYLRQQPEIRYAYQINGRNVHFDIPAGNR